MKRTFYATLPMGAGVPRTVTYRVSPGAGAVFEEFSLQANGVFEDRLELVATAVESRVALGSAAFADTDGTGLVETAGGPARFTFKEEN